MRITFIAILLFFTTFSFSQSAQLAYSYFRKGEYEKASVLYKQLHEKNAIRRDYFKRLLSCYQLTERFEEASNLLNQQKQRFPSQQYLNIEIGYNLQLQDQPDLALPYYESALKSVEKHPNSGYLVGKTFQDNHLLDYSLKAYKKAMKLNPNLNYDAYIAFIYGEKAEIENMFDSYLNMVDKNPSYFSTVQRYAGRFLSDDNQDANNILFRKLLLKRLQSNPSNAWNMLLSWLYMQQKDYDKALIQEKAIYLRNQEGLERIIEVGDLAFTNEDYETTKNTFQYVLENTGDQNIQLEAQLYLLDAGIETATSKGELDLLDQKFNDLFKQYGINNNTIDLQVAYADFLTFKKDNPQKAIEVLNGALSRASSDFQEGEVKIKLADVLVYTNQFNQALIHYTQVQTKLKNSTLAQTARFKVAQTSYFKGDFKWASTQLKVLKGSTSQLIANDAVDLFLLISDNLGYDSIPKALQLYAKADLLAFQNKNIEAIDSLTLVLENHKDHEIEDVALFKQAQLFEKLSNFHRLKATIKK